MRGQGTVWPIILICARDGDLVQPMDREVPYPCALCPPGEPKVQVPQSKRREVNAGVMMPICVPCYFRERRRNPQWAAGPWLGLSETDRALLSSYGIPDPNGFAQAVYAALELTSGAR